jgi:hypothetical protein
LKPLLAMLTLSLRRLVFVAAGARISEIITRMTDLAGDVARAAMIQGKAVVAEASG